MNFDYKILTKVLANRLEKVPKIINPDQTGYVKGRYIGENIRLIQDPMFYLEKENSTGMAVFVDFRKAFDTIEWNYLGKALMLFNFGPNFLQWFRTIYSNISSCVLNNGHASHFFSLTRGVRQGCPLSDLQFVFNTSKTEAMWLGKWKDRSDTPFNFNWPVDPICALGVFFSYDTTKADKLNFDEKLRNTNKILNIWKNRKLTLIGKINIVKTLALSKLIFNSSNLYLPKNLSDTINSMIFNFIWQGKPPKIKRMTIVGEKK